MNSKARKNRLSTREGYLLVDWFVCHLKMCKGLAFMSTKILSEKWNIRKRIIRGNVIRETDIRRKLAQPGVHRQSLILHQKKSVLKCGTLLVESKNYGLHTRHHCHSLLGSIKTHVTGDKLSAGSHSSPVPVKDCPRQVTQKTMSMMPPHLLRTAQRFAWLNVVWMLYFSLGMCASMVRETIQIFYAP